MHQWVHYPYMHIHTQTILLYLDCPGESWKESSSHPRLLSKTTFDKEDAEPHMDDHNASQARSSILIFHDFWYTVEFLPRRNSLPNSIRHTHSLAAILAHPLAKSSCILSVNTIILTSFIQQLVWLPVISQTKLMPVNLTSRLGKLITVPIVKDTKHWFQYLLLICLSM